MKIWKLAIFAAVLAGASYAASPAVTGWMIKEAVEDGDAAYLDQKIAWDEVRASLTPSLHEMAGVPPQTAAASAVKPGWWTRIKVNFARTAVDKLVNNYLTPEGLPQLFNYRQTYRATVGTSEPPKTLANLPDRMKAFAARVVGAGFTGLTSFEMQVRDKNDASRIFTARLDLRSTGWVLTALSLRVEPPADVPAEAL